MNDKEETMQIRSLEKELSKNTYPGRGIVAGRSDDGRFAVAAYFIMGRSENSRNRIFVSDGDGLRTQAYDPARMKDPSLIIYSPVRVLGHDTIVTNGDQTDTVFEGLEKGLSFERALRSRTYEPDSPNFTPRISALLHVEGGEYYYEMSILKSHHGNPECTDRQHFFYDHPIAGEGSFLHTYVSDGNPLPSFEGEPVRVNISGNIDSFGKLLWESLNSDNKVSLFVRYIDLETAESETRIYNKWE